MKKSQQIFVISKLARNRLEEEKGRKNIATRTEDFSVTSLPLRACNSVKLSFRQIGVASCGSSGRSRLPTTIIRWVPPQPVESSGGAAARILAGGSFVNLVRGHPLCKFRGRGARRGDRFDLLLLLIYLSTVPPIGGESSKATGSVSSAFYTLYASMLGRRFATMRISCIFFFFFNLFNFPFWIACLALSVFSGK